MEAEIGMLLAASETLPPVATANPPMFEDTHAFSTRIAFRERLRLLESRLRSAFWEVKGGRNGEKW